MVVSIGDMKGLPNPEAFQQLEVGSEGPLITYSYYVTYQFAGGGEPKDKGSPEVCVCAPGNKQHGKSQQGELHLQPMG